MNILAVIPAKGQSGRLPNKNMKLIGNKTLIEIAVDYVKKSKLISDIVISTDSLEVLKFVHCKNLCECFIRSEGLSGEADVTEVYCDAREKMGGIADYVVGIQPDHPDRTLPVDSWKK